MATEIINTPLIIHVHGVAGKAVNRDYKSTGFKLMDKMWAEIKSRNLKHKGINTWIYEKDDAMFAGVELENNDNADTGLEEKKVTLKKYARYKHIGPYRDLSEAYSKMKEEIKEKGLTACLPFLEIYGHWTNDESKLETDILMSLE